MGPGQLFTGQKKRNKERMVSRWKDTGACIAVTEAKVRTHI